MNDSLGSEPRDPSPQASKLIFVALGILIAAGVAFATFYRKAIPPPSKEISGDPLLVQGHELYQMRCVSCHGVTGRGDGPIAATSGPTPVGDLSDNQWKHGDTPEQVLNVVTNGVRGTSMSAWSSAFNAQELRALAAYVYHLAGRDVPPQLRVGAKEAH